jgi:hypothetical protein
MLSLILILAAAGCFLCYAFSWFKKVPPQVFMGVGLALAVISRVV